MINKTPRILFVGDLNFYSKGASRLNALEAMNVELFTLSHSPIGGNEHGYVSPSLPFRIAWKFGFHLDSEDVNRNIIKTVRSKHLDLLWIEKGNMIKPSTLRAVKRLIPSIKIVSYSDDDMFAPLNHTRAYVDGLKYYDVIFTTKSYNTNPDELPTFGAKRCVMVDKAFDPSQHRPIDLKKNEIEYFGADVGFIGSYAPERIEVLEALADSGAKVRVWGNGWHGCSPASENLHIEYQPLVNTPEDLRYSKGICATKINLGFLRKINRDLQTDRSIEIPACAGFMIAERSNEHERLFRDGREAVYFDTMTDLIKKVRYYLAHDEERQIIAKAGRMKCETGKFSHSDRMEFMLKEALTE